MALMQPAPRCRMFWSRNVSEPAKTSKPAFAGTPMVGQQAQLREQPRERAPRLWNGISKVRVNLGTAIVGDPQQVTEELLAYWRLGIDEFILSGFPHEEECRRVASEILPPLRAAIARER